MRARLYMLMIDVTLLVGFGPAAAATVLLDRAAVRLALPD